MAHIMNFSEYTAPAGAITESLTQRSVTTRFNKAFGLFKESLVAGDAKMFVASMDGLLNLFDEFYDEKRDDNHSDYCIEMKFCLHYDRGHKFRREDAPEIGRWNGCDTKAITEFNSYTVGNKWSWNAREKDIVPFFKFEFKWCGENAHKVVVNETIDCLDDQTNGQEKFFSRIKEQFISLIRSEAERMKTAGAFGDKTLERYNMVGVTDYVGWVTDNVASIVKSNGLRDIRLYGMEWEFQNGCLERLCDSCIKYSVYGYGDDCGDDEISYSEWASASRYQKYNRYAERYCNIPYDKKVELSKKIYDYVFSLLKDGKLK